MSLSFFIPSLGDIALVPAWPNAGAPTSGSSGTLLGIVSKGDLLVDTTNAIVYLCTASSSSSITWTQQNLGTSTAAITGGTINGTTIGGTTPAPVTTSALHVDTGTKTATATSGAATLNKMAGVITTESLTTAAGADYTLTLTNSDVAAADQVFASVQLGSATTGVPTIATVTPGANSVVIVVQNIAASALFNGTLKISFLVVKN